MLTALLILATVIVASCCAAIAARACRSAHETARVLGADGKALHLIAKRTGLPQDVVAMLLAGSHARSLAPRQKMPSSAGTARGAITTRVATLLAAPVTRRSAPVTRPALRGTDVALT